MDEVIGLRSRLGGQGSDLCPQDLFSWSSAGHRNITSSGTRYFSINGGSTNIVNFNQDPKGDFGDWLSEACPQTHPYVQNAFGCTGQSSDIAATSPEGVNLDVIGYDLVNAPTAGWQLVAIGDFNHNGKPDYVLYNGGTRQTAIWYMKDAVFAGGAYGPTLPAGWRVVGVADFNRDGKPDYLLFNASTHQSAIWYLSGVTLVQGAFGQPCPALGHWWGSAISTGTANRITYSSMPARVSLRCGIYRERRFSAVHMAQPSPAVGHWWGSAISTGTANRITCCTTRAPAKPRSGT